MEVVISLDDSRLASELKKLVDLLGVGFEEIAKAVGYLGEEPKGSIEELMRQYEELMTGYDEVFEERLFREYEHHRNQRVTMPKQTYFPKVRATARSTC